MDQSEIEILGRQLARAHPPPILHRYRRPTAHTLEELNERQIFAAMPDDLNDPSQLLDHVSLRKAAEWEFEQEYRIPLGQIGNRPRVLPYDASALAVIRFGARVEDEFRGRVMEAIAHLQQRPTLIQMRCDFD